MGHDGNRAIGNFHKNGFCLKNKKNKTSETPSDAREFGIRWRFRIHFYIYFYIKKNMFAKVTYSPVTIMSYAVF